jgi:hypothetical protein
LNGVNIVLDVAFVIASVAFFKKQFNVKDGIALLLAFATALIIGLAPIIAGMLPITGPFIEVVIKVIVLFLTAAGSVDFTTEMIKRANQARAPGTKS